MHHLSALLMITCFASIGSISSAQNTQAPKKLPGGLVYVWGDEFNGKTLDTKKWQPELGVIRNQGSQQTYTDKTKNLRIEKGCLILETHFEKCKNSNYKKNGLGWTQTTEYMPYTSASVNSINTKTFLFGRLEVRAKVPKTKGIWPAIWLLGKNSWGWPANGEIDMLENISQQPDTVYATFHMSPDGVSRKDKSMGGTVKIPNLSQEFHTYIMEWDKNTIRLLIDDKEVKSIKLADTNYPNGGNPFLTPFYIIINSAVGGSWCEKAPLDGTGFPVKFEIDYVRLYQTKEQFEDNKKINPKTGKLKK